MSVYWLLNASENFRAALNGQSVPLAQRLEEVNAVLEKVFPGDVVIVRDRFSGYRPFDGLVILLVEVQPGPNPVAGDFHSPATYIVKIALDDEGGELKREIAAWNSTRPAHLRSDNVFVSLEAHPEPQNPRALVYGDAFAVLGQRNVTSLEEAISQSCRFGVPRPESIVRLLRSLYERLGTHFYPHSHLEAPAVYLHASRPNLGELLDRYDESVAPTDDTERCYDLDRRQYRRETLALLAGDHEAFADPIDLLRGMRGANIGPQILRGSSHGDLHARNVQVAVVGDEVSQGAIYDYEGFGTENFPAWDFIKMEIELAVRLLDRFGHRDRPTFVRQCLRFWSYVAARAERDDQDRAPLAGILPDLGMGGPEWQRLADLLVSVRMMAAATLGRDRGRVMTWLAEYELLTAWYATRSSLFRTYEPRWTVAALVAAGVAARRLMRRLDANVELSHRRRLLAARQPAGDRDTARMQQGERLLETLGTEYPHVLEIQEQLALVRIRLARYDAAEAVLDSISERYSHTSAETPSLLGSLWKKRAFAVNPMDTHALERAATWYRRAVERHPNDFYPRINVATILLIQGRISEAALEAEAVLALLDRPGERDFWSIATRGEAMVLLGGDIEVALGHYRQAIRDRNCRDQDRRSMHDQLVFLRGHFPSEVGDLLSDTVLQNLFFPAQETPV